jgi:AraC-like DNA-binding protein
VSISTQHVDSPLGRWAHSEWSPARLAGVVERISFFEGTLTFPRERVFPDGRIELNLQLGEPHRLVRGGESEPFPAACLSGLAPSSFVIEAPPGPCRVLGVRLSPAGAYALLARPLSELTGITVDLGDLFGPAAAELMERCREAADGEEILRITADWIAGRLARSPAADPAIAWTAAQIESRSGAVSIAELRERTGLSKTRLATVFREQIGLTPKHYARIHRFRRVLDLLRRREEPLAETALAAGYYDQPHMNAEFREMAGLTPGEFLAAVRYPGSASLAEGA